MVTETPAVGLTPTRMQSAVLSPIGDRGRAELVEQRLGRAITGGVLQAGERLPSESELARTLGVSPVTVREALGILRERGLITTRRGRNGGSFVTTTTDPVDYTRQRLRELTRLALRDLGLHYLAIGTSCVRLAAERAHPSEIAPIRERLEGGLTADRTEWGRHYDESLLELTSLSQSARLTQEQMRLQAEISPLLTLIDDGGDHGSGDQGGGDQKDGGGGARRRQFTALAAVLDAVAAGDPETAAAEFGAITRENIERLVELHSELQPDPGEDS